VDYWHLSLREGTGLAQAMQCNEGKGRSLGSQPGGLPVTPLGKSPQVDICMYILHYTHRIMTYVSFKT